MPTHPPSRKGRRPTPAPDRRAGPAEAGSVRWLKGMLGRPIGFEMRDNQLRIVLVDRRRKPSGQPADVLHLQSALGACLAAQQHEHAAAVLRHLRLVHEQLGRKGWTGVGQLPAAALRKALLQAEMLAGHEPSPPLAEIVERLRVLQVAAELRDERDTRASRLQDFQVGRHLEVSETTQEAFEETERSWVGTIPPPADLPDRTP